LTAANQSNNRCDFALVTMLGLLGLRIFEATGSDIPNLGEEHGHRVLRMHGKGDKVVLAPRTWTATPTTSLLRTWPLGPERRPVVPMSGR
jgi:hypothetical protein